MKINVGKTEVMNLSSKEYTVRTINDGRIAKLKKCRYCIWKLY